MPRCGHASRSAKAFPMRSRLITKGIPSSMALCRRPRVTLSEGKARYQKPVSISESGVSRSSSAVDMGQGQPNTANLSVWDGHPYPHCHSSGYGKYELAELAELYCHGTNHSSQKGANEAAGVSAAAFGVGDCRGGVGST